MAAKGSGQTVRTVKLTVRCSDGTEGEAEPTEPLYPAPGEDDPFALFTYPPEDLEDAVLLRMEEAEDVGDIGGEYEMVTSALFRSDGRTVSISYEEELTGPGETTQTLITFSADAPGSVVVMRTGAAESTLVFEQGKAHTSIYETPVFPLEVTVRARKVTNTVSPVTGRGEMFFDYVVTVKGMESRRTVMKIISE